MLVYPQFYTLNAPLVNEMEVVHVCNESACLLPISVLYKNTIGAVL